MTSSTVPYATEPLLGRCVEALEQEAPLGAPISQWLEQSLEGGPSYRRQAKAVFRFLEVLKGGDECLITAVKDWRSNPALFAREFVQRVRVGYSKAGMTAECNTFIGHPDCSEKTLRLLLEHEELFEKYAEERSKENVIRTVAHFHNLIRQKFTPETQECVPDSLAAQSKDHQLDSMLSEDTSQHHRVDVYSVFNFEYRIQQMRRAADASVKATLHIDSPVPLEELGPDQASWFESLAARLLDEAESLENGTKDRRFLRVNVTRALAERLNAQQVSDG